MAVSDGVCMYAGILGLECKRLKMRLTMRLMMLAHQLRSIY